MNPPKTLLRQAAAPAETSVVVESDVWGRALAEAEKMWADADQLDLLIAKDMAAGAADTEGRCTVDARVRGLKGQAEDLRGRARDLYLELCTPNPCKGWHPAKARLAAVCSVFARSSVDGNEILSIWRSAVEFLKGAKREELLDLIETVAVGRFEPPTAIGDTERCLMAVFLFNLGDFPRAYAGFAELAAGAAVMVANRVEASRYLFASDDDDKRRLAEDSLFRVVQDPLYSPQFRFRIVSSFNSRTGISTFFNTTKLRAAYDPEFLVSLLTAFFYTEAKAADLEGTTLLESIQQRILAADALLGLAAEQGGEEDAELYEFLDRVARDRAQTGQTRADAADVILRHSSDERLARARLMITELGWELDGGQVESRFRTVYSDAQNVHNTAISQSVRDAIVKLFAGSGASDDPSLRGLALGGSSYTDAHRDICQMVAKSPAEPGDKDKMIRSLDRIGVDTATFTDLGVTNATILLKVWTAVRANPQREAMEKRLADELLDMSGWCSSGHAARLVNVLSSFDEAVRISWKDQIVSNVQGRLMAMFAAHEPEAEREAVASGMLPDAEEQDKRVYRRAAAKHLATLGVEMEKEFVGGGWVGEAEFSEGWGEAYAKWL